MITVQPQASAPHSRVTTSSSVSAAPLSTVPHANDKTAVASATIRDVTSSTVSILARQLSEAATRAETRAGQVSANPLHSITGDNYLANKAQHDTETPSTENPELLARARQATGFVNGTDSNPFKELARNQLSLIAGDDGGSFTVNERRAAWEALASTAPKVATQSSPASVNGRDLMISRLYNGNEPPVAKPPATVYNGTQNHADFLNRDDRALISDMYAYAKAEGADLYFVDRVAIELGTYRHYSDGLQLGGSNVRYDWDGFQVTFDYKPEDAANASRILEGSAINSTRLDQGFLRYILSPSQGTFSNIGGIPFLERMVKKFSSEGADQPPLGSEFATFKRAKREDHVVQTTDKNIRLAPFKALTETVNGVWHLTEHGKTAGYLMDKSTGRLYKPTDPLSDQVQQRLPLSIPAGKAPNNTLFDALADTREQPTTRWIWPGHLFKLMKNFKP